MACVSMTALLLCTACQTKLKEPTEVYRTEVSPDQRFKVVVYRAPMDRALPGQSSDAPGLVRLYDQKTGKVLQQKNVEMVQLIDQFEWTATHLHIKLFADWPLPEDLDAPKAELALGPTCIQAGPLACDTTPFKKLHDACAHLKHCVQGRDIEGVSIAQLQSCDELSFSARTRSSNYAASDYAALGAYLESTGPTTYAVFLFNRTDQGWCAADILHMPEWTHGGDCTTRFDVSASKDQAAHGWVNVSSEKICHIALDQEELAAQQSDIASEACVQARYRTTPRGMEKNTSSQTATRCSFK